MRVLIDHAAPQLMITQDLGLGMMLWMTQFFPEEGWAVAQRARCLDMLDKMWLDEGYFCREPGYPHVKFAFSNYGVSIGLQAVNATQSRKPIPSLAVAMQQRAWMQGLGDAATIFNLSAKFTRIYSS